MDKIEQICRALCIQDQIDPNVDVYNTKVEGNTSPAWKLKEDFVQSVLKIIELNT